MCGILCYVSAGKPCSEPTPELVSLLQARGPDQYGGATATFPTSEAITNTSSTRPDRTALYVRCYASVLSLRGNTITKQPMQTVSNLNVLNRKQKHTGAPILCWNGEIFGAYGQPLGTLIAGVSGDARSEDVSFTAAPESDLDHRSGKKNSSGLEHALSYDQSDTAWLYFRLCEAAKHDFQTREVPPDDDKLHARDAVGLVIDSIQGPFAVVFVDTLNGRLHCCRDKLGRRSLLVKRVSDSEICFASVSDGTEGWTEVNPEGKCVLDLNNPGTLRSAQNEQHKEIHGRVRMFDEEHDSERPEFNQRNPTSPPEPLGTESASVATLHDLLRDALDVRLRSLPASFNQKQVRSAVLFSGGLDCTTLARMMHDILPVNEPIDLLNVAFENPRISKNMTTEESCSICPDRVTALASHAELATVCPERSWRLIKIDVPYTETLAHRPTIKMLMHPHDTEMDLSIATALYFAARGQGALLPYTAPSLPTCSSPPSGPLSSLSTNDPLKMNDQDSNGCPPESRYRTPARVLISGLGADELFAGYQRHATAFSRGGHAALLAELKLDYERLGTRNLGRDDRVLSHWGRECRFPFLDERVVQWAVSADIGEKCGFGAAACSRGDKGEEEGGEGMADLGQEAREELRDTLGKADDIEPGKKVLRLVAERLGMHGVAREKKRAIQFGARSAKMESGRSRGTDVL